MREGRLEIREAKAAASRRARFCVTSTHCISELADKSATLKSRNSDGQVTRMKVALLRTADVL